MFATLDDLEYSLLGSFLITSLLSTCSVAAAPLRVTLTTW